MVMTPQPWRALRSVIGKTDKSHHVATRVLRTFGVTKAPVDVRSIAKQMGVEVRETPEPGWSGAIQSSETTAVCWLNSTEAEVRKRFTLAHELGHLLLHPLGMEFRDVTFAGSSRESEANRFAADLLIPLWMLDAYAPSMSGNVESLARAFSVSTHAMQIQLDKLNGHQIHW